MYATLEDIRGEGVLPTQAGDVRVLTAIEEASRLVDQLTGWFFGLRHMELRLDGRGAPTLWLPVPVVRIVRFEVHGVPLLIGPGDLHIVGAPIAGVLDGPRVTRTRGAFPRGRGNILLEGLFGVTEPDGTPTGRVPLAIRRATILLAIQRLPRVGNNLDDPAARRPVVEERTRDQSVKFAEPASSPLSGDLDVDAMLRPYLRPPMLGAA